MVEVAYVVKVGYTVNIGSLRVALDFDSDKFRINHCLSIIFLSMIDLSACSSALDRSWIRRCKARGAVRR